MSGWYRDCIKYDHWLQDEVQSNECYVNFMEKYLGRPLNIEYIFSSKEGRSGMLDRIVWWKELEQEVWGHLGNAEFSSFKSGLYEGEMKE